MLEYVTNINAIITNLKAHNTITATPDLSNGLNLRIDNDNIKAEDPEVVSWRADMLPAVFARISFKDEEFEGIGNIGSTANRVRKMATVTYQIFGITQKYGGYTEHSNLLDDVYTLGRNIEGVINQETRMSNTALWTNLETTEFYSPVAFEGLWTKVVSITVKGKYLYK